MSLCLFIGGPKDGRWIDVEPAIDTYKSPVMATGGTPTMLTHSYRAVRYIEAGAVRRIFVDTAIQDAHLFSILVKGYRR